MSLICKTEFFVSANIIDICCIVLLNRILTAFSILRAFAVTAFFHRFNLLYQMIMLVEQLVSVNPCDNVNWDVGSLMFEATMNINMGIN